MKSSKMKKIYETAYALTNEALSKTSENAELIRHMIKTGYQTVLILASHNSWDLAIDTLLELNFLTTKYKQMQSECFDLSLKTISLRAKIKKIEGTL